jgi:hypothetical protein
MADGADGEAENEEHWTSWDDNALAEQMDRLRSSSSKCGRPEQVLSSLDSTWVLIFNAGRHDEGVYTLQGRAASEKAYVLAFEFSDDADRFAALLQAEGFDLATPLSWDTQQLSAFCDAGEFDVSLVQQGALVTPPAQNEYEERAPRSGSLQSSGVQTEGGRALQPDELLERAFHARPSHMPRDEAVNPPTLCYVYIDHQGAGTHVVTVRFGRPNAGADARAGSTLISSAHVPCVLAPVCEQHVPEEYFGMYEQHSSRPCSMHSEPLTLSTLSLPPYPRRASLATQSSHP